MTSSGQDLVRIAATSDAEPLGVVARLYWPDDLLFENALEALARPCMESLGFEFVSVTQFIAANLQNDTLEGTAAAYKLTVADARRYGYRSTAGVLPLRLEPPVYSESYYEAFFGDGSGDDVTVEDEQGRVVEHVSRGGCRGMAERRLFDNLSDYFSLRPILEDARNSAISRVYTSTPWRQNMELWSDCMSSLGYEYGDIATLRESIAYDDEGPSSTEISVATADAQCRQRNDTDQLFVDLLWSAEEEWIESNPEFLERYTQMRQRASAVAADLLSS